MSLSKTNLILSTLIILLAGFAAIAGLTSKQPVGPDSVTSVYGETVPLHGRGTYHHDSVSMAAQAKAQDVVTLLVGIPLLTAALLWARKSALGGRLLLTGTLGYFLYTYTSLTFLAAYNQLFLVYVAVLSLSIFAIILAFRQVDVESLPDRFSEKLPTKLIAGFMALISLMLLFLWMERIIPSLDGHTAPFGLEHYTTLVIQALDLSLIIPLGFVAAVLMWRKQPWGYMLSAIMMIKGLTLLLAICAMIVAQLMADVPVAAVEMVVFPLFTLIDLALVVLLFRGIRPAKSQVELSRHCD